MEQKKYLNNVAIIRVILIVLLVFYHAFLVYSGGWDLSGEYPLIKSYWWLDKLSFAFMLETFVFISGYVFGFQVRTKGKVKLDPKSLFWSKFKRLLIPSMTFSLLYILLFKDISQPILTTFRGVIEGEAHRWFLPMLFWCFWGIWVIEKLNLKPKFVLPFLILCSICSFLPLPMQLNVTMYYMLFFYTGYLLQRKSIGLEKYYKPKYAVALCLLFFIIFPLLTLFRQNAGEIIANKWGDLFGNHMFASVVKHVLLNTAKMIYSSLGLATLFVIVGLSEQRRTSPLPQWVTKVGALCMGVYLFQQFFLMAIYRCSSLPNTVDPYVMPWISFAVALLGSLMISYLLRLTKVGRLIIG